MFTVTVASLDFVQESLRVLSEDERRRADRYKKDRDRRRFIAARATLRRLLASQLGVEPNEIEFVYGAYGKPALSGQFQSANLHFNISHCRDLAAYAFADRQIGIDIEAVRDLPDADRIAARFFSASDNDAFFNCWTRREALVKAIGIGIAEPLDSIDTSRWSVHSFTPAPGFAGAVATENA